MSDDFDALLDAAIERKTAEKKTRETNIILGGKPVELRFTELDSQEWARCTIAHHPRTDVPMDMMFGYNLTAAAEHAAPLSGVRLVDGEECKVTDEQWVKIFKAVDPQGRQAITDAIFEVNEHAQIERIRAAKKVSEGASKRKRPSPAK